MADFSLKQGRGHIYVSVLQHDPRAAGPRVGAWRQDLQWSDLLDDPADGDIVHVRLLGFSYRRWVKGTGTFYPNWLSPGSRVTLPHWFAVTVFAVPVVVAARRRRARVR